MKKTVEDAFETFPHLKPEGNHPENPDSSTGTEFKPGEKVEVHSPTTKAWQEATIVDVDKEHTLYRVRFPHGTVSIRPACYVRHVVKEDKPQAEGCEELVQKDALREKRNEALLELRKVFLDSVNAKKEEKN